LAAASSVRSWRAVPSFTDSIPMRLASSGSHPVRAPAAGSSRMSPISPTAPAAIKSHSNCWPPSTGAATAHGYLHEHPNELSADEERHWLYRSLAAVEAISGAKPAGWRAPLYNFSHRSTALLLEAGIAYDASLMGDDVPYLVETPCGALLELPSHWGMDDWPPFMHSIELDFQMPVQSAAAAWEGWWEEFEAMWEHGGLWVPVWHPLSLGTSRALAPHPPDDRPHARPRPGLVRADARDRGAHSQLYGRWNLDAAPHHGAGTAGRRGTAAPPPARLTARSAGAAQPAWHTPLFSIVVTLKLRGRPNNRLTHAQ
jgi:hypothetical protein